MEQHNVKDISDWVDPTNMPRSWQKYTYESISHLIRSRTHLTMNDVNRLWQVPERYYHSTSHMMDLVSRVNISIAVQKGWFDKNMEFGLCLDGISDDTLDDLILAIVFHDIVYIPGSRLNEQVSGELWLAASNHGPHLYDRRAYDIRYAILMTDYAKYTHKFCKDHELGRLLRAVDLVSCFHAGDEEMRQNYKNVYEEVKHLCSPEEFRLKNLEFLSKYVYDGVEGGGEAFERYQKVTESVVLSPLN